MEWSPSWSEAPAVMESQKMKGGPRAQPMCALVPDVLHWCCRAVAIAFAVVRGV